MKKQLTLLFIGLILLIVLFQRSNSFEPTLSLDEVWQNADTLEGQHIRIQANARLFYDSYHPMQIGGCSLDPNGNSPVEARAMLVNESPNDLSQRILIDDASFLCTGNTCQINCTPFEPPPDLWGTTDPELPLFEFAGVLTRAPEGSETSLIFAEIDVSASRRLRDGRWQPLSSGEFSYMFP